MPMGEVLIEVCGLDIEIGSVEILSQIEFQLHRSEFLSIIGPNGSGKTTLLRALDGLYFPQAGEILLSGVPLNSLPRRRLARQISYVPQGDPGGLDFTVRTFVELGRYPHLGSWESLRPEDIDAIQQAMEITGISQFSQRPLGALSGGERQRVLIAAALAQGAEILLLDEPTSYLDYKHQQQVLGLLGRLHREGAYSCVMVTHDLNAASRLSDSILVLKEGRLVARGAPDEVLQGPGLEKIFEVPFRMLDQDPLRRPSILPELGES